MSKTSETPTEVNSSDNLNQIDCITKSNAEDNSTDYHHVYLKQVISDPVNTIVQQQITGNEVRMLVIHSGKREQTVITFVVPKDDCTVQDLLEQAQISALQDCCVSLVSDPTHGIDYIVEIMLKSSQKDEPYVGSKEAAGVSSTVESTSPSKNDNASSTTPRIISDSKVAKCAKEMLAVCPFCAMRTANFDFCVRCKRKLPEDVKTVSSNTSNPSAKKACAAPPSPFYNESKTPKLKRDAGAKRGGIRGKRITRFTGPKKEPCDIIKIQSSTLEFENFEKFLNSEKLSDVTLCMKDRYIHAHKVILSNKSPVFEAMFVHETIESVNREVVISDVDYNTMYELLRYIYTGKLGDVEKSYSILEYSSILVAANKYCVNCLKTKCEEKLLLLFTIENVLDCFVLANLQDAVNLRKKAIDFIVENIEKMIDLPSYKAFVKLYADMSIEITRALTDKQKN